MILPAPEPPPTAQQSFAAGHETPSSAFVVGEVSGDQPAARAAGALARPKRASTPAASTTGKAMVRAPRRPLTARFLSNPDAGRVGDDRTGPPLQCRRTLQGRSA